MNHDSPYYRQAMQMNAVANAPRTLVNFLTGLNFVPRGQAQATIQKMWQDWTKIWNEKASMTADAWTTP